MLPSPAHLLEQAIRHFQAGHWTQSETLCLDIPAHTDQHIQAQHLRGVIAFQQGRFGDADNLIGSYLRKAPADIQALSNHAAALNALGGFEAALRESCMALAIRPAQAAALSNLGVSLKGLACHAQAYKVLRRSLSLDPNAIEAETNYAGVLVDIGRFAEAVRSYDRALQKRPLLVEAHHGRNLALLELGEIDAAFVGTRLALALVPADLLLHEVMGRLYFTIGDIAEARLLHTRVNVISPKAAPANVKQALLSLAYDPEPDPAQHHAAIQEQLRRLPPVYSGLQSVAAGRKRIKVGYVSSDFRSHPVAYNLLPIMRHHNRNEFEIICYSNVRQPDPVSQQFEALADRWIPINSLTDADAAARIRNDEIDVLVHLAGRFDQNRPFIARHRPALVQISFHDVASSGLVEMDYLIADRWLAPRKGSEIFSERIIRLPSFVLRDRIEDAPPVGPARYDKPPVFGSFNNPSKVNDRVLSLWGRLLRAAPDARLKLKYKNHFGSEVLRRQVLSKLNVPAERVEFIVPNDHSIEAHLKPYDDIDISLDPFPFSGATTSFESLWMGIPVLTLPGPMMVSRWTLSMLETIGLRDFVAIDAEDFVEKGARLIKDRSRLAELRGVVRDRILRSGLSRGKRRAQNLEQVFRTVHRRALAENRT